MPNDISEWIGSYASEAKKDTLVVGISGGIDSSLVSTLCAMTGLKTIVVRMPIHQHKEQNDLSDKHARWLLDKFPDNTIYKTKELSDVFDVFGDLLDDPEKDELSLANTRSRMRMVMLYQIASTHNGIVVGTGNKVEDFGIGFFTKYGDCCVDISPIADLYKTEVRSMAKELGILDEFIEAAPTDGLWDDGRTDEEQIGATYEELEWAMQYKTGEPVQEHQSQILKIYNALHNSNKHKMLPIPIYTRDRKKKKDLLIMIDLVPMDHYLELAKPWHISYVINKLCSIRETLVHCQKEGIDIQNINYVCDTDNEILYDQDFSLGEFDYSTYDHIYYAGASIDACLTRTRRESYLNLDHPNKFIVLDCCIQDTERLYSPEGPRGVWKSREQMDDYIQKYLIDMNINTVPSLLTEEK